ncbi:MAG: AAA family ATPase [Alphaproteobacteria bacterium 16-39-46]|nr:MAG: AAA family ATPase [Alphaproteobacteria bacterium 16-39-46]OZA42821.1 MAG: AAA family ATPase [Alphaproteobacteria bacterium 17-39-52]HQS84268.1 AAA family ATPase [Alphaproteobacteria bacterium]HQS94116.1 AAA family ATPase [Alphaproteobacteria bacterium]
MNIDLNADFTRALDLMENTSQNIFITGRAGVGKSTLLTYFREQTKKKIAVLAPTGVAAINVQGQTIHSFFKFKPSITLQSVKKTYEDDKKNIYKKLDAIVIDEISMVRADLLDCVDRFLRLNGKDSERPFGGIQMIFIGDLYQLPPVVTSQEKEAFSTLYKSPYFFSAHFFNEFEMEFIELEKIYRQQDETFINLLNSIRNKTTTEEDISLLNARVQLEETEDDYGVYLTPKNVDVETLNEKKLNQLKEKKHVFEARIEGTFGKESYPTREVLNIKVGAQVMMVNNDPKGRWVNGTMGKVIYIEKQDDVIGIGVTLEDGKKVEVFPNKWEVHRFFLEADNIQSESVGAFTQYPLTLAWALTIHKSQGKTFKKVTLDIGSGSFMPGQVYVALSRCTTLEGLTLKKPILKKHIWLDYEVVKFVTNFQYQKSESNCSLDQKKEIIEAFLEKNEAFEMIYLKANNEKSQRRITPAVLGMMSYKGASYLGMKGFCHQSQEEKVFRVDRILEIIEKGDDPALS